MSENKKRSYPQGKRTQIKAVHNPVMAGAMPIQNVPDLSSPEIGKHHSDLLAGHLTPFHRSRHAAAESVILNSALTVAQFFEKRNRFF